MLHFIIIINEKVPYFVFSISAINKKWNLETYISNFTVTLKSKSEI